MSWIGTAIAYVVEHQAGGKTVDELIAKLAASGPAVAERMAREDDKWDGVSGRARSANCGR